MRTLDETPTATDRELRYAMLSVYYHTVGRQFQISGAPSVMLPPEMQPLNLGGALEVLASSPTRLREALWRIVQSVPLNSSAPGQSGNLKVAAVYPDALRNYLQGRKLTELDSLRESYRTGANVFAAVLVACRDNNFKLSDALVGVLSAGAGPTDKRSWNVAAKGGHNFSTAINKLVGVSAPDHLQQMFATLGSTGMRKQTARIESEIGCSVQDFVEGLADVAAFDEFLGDWPNPVTATRRATSLAEFNPAIANPSKLPRSLKIYPTCTVVRQNVKSLVTTATSTTIVQGDFEQVCAAVNPENWGRSSDIVKESNFISNALTLTRIGDHIPPEKRRPTKSQLLEEVAEISWNGNPDQQATFHNVLNTLFWTGDLQGTETNQGGQERRTADVEYNLCRSIDSVLLWDRRAGGLLVDEGYIKVRPLRENTWRVTMRKDVQFSDRTPYENAPGVQDFGQMANYLAPATLSQWLECETYSLGDPPSRAP